MASYVQHSAECLKGAMGIKSTLHMVAQHDDALKPLGQMFVRVALLLTRKEMFGREKIVYALPEIQSMSLKDMSELVGKKIRPQFHKFRPPPPSPSSDNPGLPIKVIHYAAGEYSTSSTLIRRFTLLS